MKFFKKGAVAVAMALGLLGAAQVAPASAAPERAQSATAIRCKVTAKKLNTRTLRATITSNKTIYYGQTSFIFTFVNKNKRLQSYKYDEGYGRTFTISRPAGSREWYSVQGWHAGTKCTTWYDRGAA